MEYLCWNPFIILTLATVSIISLPPCELLQFMDVPTWAKGFKKVGLYYEGYIAATISLLEKQRRIDYISPDGNCLWWMGDTGWDFCSSNDIENTNICIHLQTMKRWFCYKPLGRDYSVSKCPTNVQKLWKLTPPSKCHIELIHSFQNHSDRIAPLDLTCTSMEKAPHLSDTWFYYSLNS